MTYASKTRRKCRFQKKKKSKKIHCQGINTAGNIKEMLKEICQVET